MKKIVLLFLISATCGSAYAQKDNVGIGTTKPDQSAVLDLNSQTKGFLTPRMTLQQRSAIQNPAKGLLVFQTDMLAGFYFYNGDEWKSLNADTKSNSIAGTDGDWTMLGNPTATDANYIGTPTNVDINFKIGTQKAGLIDATSGTQNMFMGFESGQNNSATGSSNTGYGYQALKGGASITGNSNVGLGARTLSSLTSGNANLAIGTGALNLNTSGANNLAIGSSSLKKITTGSENVGLGSFSLTESVIGKQNIAIGSSALYNNTNDGNVAIGYASGYSSIAGTKNVFIGFQAGYSETGSNKLYISNSNSATPLLKGEFDNKNLKINLGASKSTTVGFLAVGNFETTFAMPTNNSYRLIVQDGIITEKIKVAVKGTPDWADYVFEPSYQLMPLDKVESFVKENKHLPNVPSAEDLVKNGLDVSQTSAKLMEKIEELTLYMIELNKEIKALKLENINLKKNLEHK